MVAKNTLPPPSPPPRNRESSAYKSVAEWPSTWKRRRRRPITISPHLKSPGGPRDCINSLDRIQNTGRRVYTDAAGLPVLDVVVLSSLGSFLALA